MTLAHVLTYLLVAIFSSSQRPQHKRYRTHTHVGRSPRKVFSRNWSLSFLQFASTGFPSETYLIQGQGLSERTTGLPDMALSKSNLSYLDKVQGSSPALQKAHFTITVYSMGIRTIEESLGVKSDFFHPRTGNFRLTDLDCINGILDLMEDITSVSRKRIRLMDVQGFKDAGHVLK